MTKTLLALCASVSSYEQVIRECDNIEDLGFTLLLPDTAALMRDNQHNGSTQPASTLKRSIIIRNHLEVIGESDAILVMNYQKNAIKDYIGPNVLMEMATAFYLQKPIYILNGPPTQSPYIEEILGLEPIFLDGDLTKLLA